MTEQATVESKRVCIDCLTNAPLNADLLCALCVVCPSNCANIPCQYHCCVCGERKSPLNGDGECASCVAAQEVPLEVCTKCKWQATVLVDGLCSYCQSQLDDTPAIETTDDA